MSRWKVSEWTKRDLRRLTLVARIDGAAMVEEAIANVLTSPKKWTKGAFARNEFGMPTVPAGRRAECFCALGALQAAGNNLGMRGKRLDRAYDAAVALLLHGAYNGEAQSSSSVAFFNDDNTTTYGKVKLAFRRARSLARAELKKIEKGGDES